MEATDNLGQTQEMGTEATYALRVGEKCIHFIGETVFTDFPDVRCFQVTSQGGKIILEPIKQKLPTLEEIRDKMAALGITEEDVAAAVAEVRAERARRGGPSLREAMVLARAEAAANGLTLEILESLLNDQD